VRKSSHALHNNLHRLRQHNSSSLHSNRPRQLHRNLHLSLSNRLCLPLSRPLCLPLSNPLCLPHRNRHLSLRNRRCLPLSRPLCLPLSNRLCSPLSRPHLPHLRRLTPMNGPGILGPRTRNGLQAYTQHIEISGIWLKTRCGLISRSCVKRVSLLNVEDAGRVTQGDLELLIWNVL
jgi:hypothetical protein